MRIKQFHITRLNFFFLYVLGECMHLALWLHWIVLLAIINAWVKVHVWICWVTFSLMQLWKVCVSLCFPTWKCSTNIYLAACWEVQKVHSKGPTDFSERTGGAKYFQSVDAFLQSACQVGFPLGSEIKISCTVKSMVFKQYAVYDMWIALRQTFAIS